MELMRRALRRLAWWLTRYLYRAPVFGDVPRSRWLYLAWYATPHKLANSLRARHAYRARALVVNAYPTAPRVDPTSVCNLHCPLCPTGAGETGRGRGRMSVETYERVLDIFAEHAFCIHLWAWGEPLLHSDLWRMVAMNSARGVGTEISTHLSRHLSDEEINAMIDSGLTWLIVSVDATSCETYERYRIGGNFHCVMDNLARIAAAKRARGAMLPFVEWQFVPFSHNEHEMAEAAAMARRLCIDGLRFKPARVDKTANLTFEGEPDAALRAWRARDPQLYHAANTRTGTYLDMQCPFLWRSVTVHYDGAVAPCCETYRPEHDIARLEDFPTAWNGPAYQNARRIALGIDLTAADQRSPCYGCKVFSKPLAAAPGGSARPPVTKAGISL